MERKKRTAGVRRMKRKGRTSDGVSRQTRIREDMKGSRDHREGMTNIFKTSSVKETKKDREEQDMTKSKL